MSRLEIRLFGSPQIFHEGAPVAVDTRKATALLAYIALTGAPQQRDTLAALLWPEYDQSSARATLRRTLSTLNKALAAHHLDIHRESIGFAAQEDLWIDVLAFQDFIEQTHRHTHDRDVVCPACLPLLAEAAQLYRQPLLAGFSLRDSPPFEEWQFFQEETLRRDLSAVLERLAFGLGESGQLEQAIGIARRWLALDPLVEDAQRMLMRLYFQAGQRNAALRQYNECMRVLEDELGVEPLIETTNLHKAISKNTTLPAPETRLRFVALPAVSVDQNSSGDSKAMAAPVGGHPTATTAATRSNATPLVGRAAERQLLLDAYEQVQSSGDGQLVAITGEPGIGKTRLTEALRDALIEQSGGRLRWATSNCYRDESTLAYAPFLQALEPMLANSDTVERLRFLPQAQLAQAARLLPALAAATFTELPARSPMPTPEAHTLSENAQTQFFEALRQVVCALLAGTPPGVLFLDDLHWADHASLDLLAYLVRRLQSTPILIVAAWRLEASAPVETLEQLLRERTRAGAARRVALDRLNQEDLGELIQSIAPNTPDWVTKQLFEETEGLPFFAVEYLRSRSQAIDGQPQEGWEMPASVRDLLHSRLATLDAATLQLLGAAAVIGRSFDPVLLHDVSGRSEGETIDGIENLLAGGLIRESHFTMDHYDFSHEKIRSLVYDETSLLRRKLLHRRVAEALVRPAANPGERHSAAAFHFQQAGMIEQAAEYHLLAGENARALFANATALTHFRAALAAGHNDAARLHEAIADLYTLKGDFHAAQEHYTIATSICPRDCASNLNHKLGNVFQRLGDWSRAEQHYAASIAALEDASCGNAVAVYTDRSRNAYLSGDLEQAQQHAAQALSLARRSEEPEELAQTENILGLLAHARGELDRAVAHLEASLNTARKLADPLVQIAALNNLARVLAEPSIADAPAALARAIGLTEQALVLCQKRGDRHRQAALHNNLADLLHQAGRENEAMAQLKQAVTIFAEISAENQEPQEASALAAQLPPAEIWKLTEW